jgi:DNA-binding transcriptional regulator YiaG
MELERFEYGIGKQAVLLSAYIPIMKCQNCGYEFVGERADEIRHEKICEHLRLLSPKKVQEIRVRLGKTQKGFADLTHFGLASIQRWEQGKILQTESNDLLMRLLEFPENVERLNHWNDGKDMHSIATPQPSFKGNGLNASEIQSFEMASRVFLLNRKIG